MKFAYLRISRVDKRVVISIIKYNAKIKYIFCDVSGEMQYKNIFIAIRTYNIGKTILKKL